MSRTLLAPEVQQPAASGPASALPHHWLPEARLRLAGLAGFVGLVNLGLLLLWLLGPELPGYDVEARTLNQTAFAFQCLASVLLVGLCTSSRLPDRLVPSVGLTYQVYICWLTSLTVARGTWVLHGHLPLVTWTSALIIAFPLIVPSRPRATLTAALAAAATRPLAVLYLDLEGLLDVTLGDVALAASSPTVAALAAYMGSRLVYRFERELEGARELGSYRLDRCIGTGGMGEVWLASHALLARPAAIKVIRPELLGPGQDGQLAARFEREAQAIARLRSPHTVALYDFGRASNGSLYYAMELLDGVDLSSFVHRYGPLPVPRALHLLRQACHSLAEAHAAGIVHCDVKPANLLLCRQGGDHDVLKILDFGLAELLAGHAGRGDGPDPDGPRPIVGTPGYMAPEVLRGEVPVPASDLYALGCVAHWLLTGRKLFSGGNLADVAVGHLRGSPPTVQEAGGPAIPRALQDLIHACLAKRVDRRPTSARALGRLLAGCQADAPWGQDEAAAWWLEHAPATVVTSPDGVPAVSEDARDLADTMPAVR